MNNKKYDIDNIHRTLHSIFPFFKSKLMCKKGIHNYGVYGYDKIIEVEVKK